MSKILIGYFSRLGSTEKMAKIIQDSIKEEKVEVVCKKISDIEAEEFLGFDGIILGTPTYYGSMAWQIKRILDESVKYHGELVGKVGAAFSSATDIGGGNETAILDILHFFLIHGMIIKGYPNGDHYGPVSISEPDDRVIQQCRELGKDITALIKRLG